MVITFKVFTVRIAEDYVLILENQIELKNKILFHFKFVNNDRLIKGKT